MVIQCPSCGRKFNLERRPPLTFRCPKCSFTTPFSVLLNEQMSPSTSCLTGSGSSGNGTNPGGVYHAGADLIPANGTRVVNSLQGNGKTNVVNMDNDDRTRLVPSLQQKKNGEFIVSYAGQNYGAIKLPHGKSFDVGRRSSDSNAQVKLTPDISMSRVHAGMRTTLVNGQVVYQITSVKANNPVYVNDQPIVPGKAYNLKSGDKVKMGETILVFRMV